MTIALDRTRSSTRFFQRRDATWDEYERLRDQLVERTPLGSGKIAFYQGWLWADMGTEGPNHASFSDLITIIFGFWAFLHPDVALQSYGRCLIEQSNSNACAPDLVLYKGDDIPQWQSGEPRRILLNRHRLPDLVGEISDTTLSIDLDEQKQLYASLHIPEYWVIDVKGQRLFAFGLTNHGVYEPIETSQILDGLEIDLINQTIERLTTETNTAAANWLMKQLQKSC